MSPRRRPLERTHIARSAAPITLQARDQNPEILAYKPRGLWYEVNGGWVAWCRDEMPDWLKGRTIHRLDLGDERILRLRGARALDEFTAKYGQRDPRGLVNEYVTTNGIEWGRVAEDYDGIEIAPYIWSRRMSLMWYYGWDCASGCIWQPRGATLTPIGPVPTEGIADDLP